jgi:hypothetical protein
MEFNAAIDISLFIWDEPHFNEHKYDYYGLIRNKVFLLDRLEENKINVLMRQELIEEIWVNFPYNMIPESTKDFEGRVLQFLTNTEFIQYPNNMIEGLSSQPQQLKAYYTGNTINEVNYLLSKIHLNNIPTNLFFTFQFIWDGKNNLVTMTQKDDPKDHETFIFENTDGLVDFLSDHKATFDHNPKHDKSEYHNREAWENVGDGEKKDFISQLSCFNGIDNILPQEILGKRYPLKVNGNFIGFDHENGEYVIFKWHKDNLYHGYDEYDKDNIEKIPSKVRGFFSK